MKKLFAILAILAISTVFAYADDYNLTPATGSFSATFWCTPSVTGPTGSAHFLGNFFADGQQNDVWAFNEINPIYFDFNGGYNGQVVSVTTTVERTGVAATLEYDWDINGDLWQQANQPFTGNITLAGNQNHFVCDATARLSWHAHYVSSSVAGEVTWTATVSASVNI